MMSQKRKIGLALAALYFVACLTGLMLVTANTGEGNVGQPIMHVSSLRGLSFSCNCTIKGDFNVSYADGRSVELSSNTVIFNICTDEGICSTVSSIVHQVGVGHYAYSFKSPYCNGNDITVYVQAESLADDNGLVFPSIDTVVGHFVFPDCNVTSTATTSLERVAMPTSNSSVPAIYNNVVQNNTSTVSSSGQSYTGMYVAGLIAVFCVIGAILVKPKRKT